MKEKLKHDVVSMPRIGDQAPEFESLTARGIVNFPSDYKGKWTILFSQPTHYSPDCTLVGMNLEQIEQQFKEANCELMELKFEGTYSRVVWLRSVNEKMEYEMMKEIKMAAPYQKTSMPVAKQYAVFSLRQSCVSLILFSFCINFRFL